MTRHCLTCQGVLAVAPDPSSPIRWCQCRGPGDDTARLRAAAQAVVDRWDTPLWKDVPATAVFIEALRKELSK